MIEIAKNIDKIELTKEDEKEQEDNWDEIEIPNIKIPEKIPSLKNAKE